jgi:serralysin
MIIVAAANSTDAAKATADFVCDGVDDQVEINAAIAALGGAPGTVKLLDGDYNLGAATSNAAIVIDQSNITLTGESWATRLRLQDNADVNMIRSVGDGLHHITVTNMWLEGNSANNSSGASLEDRFEHNIIRIISDGSTLNHDCWVTNIYADDANRCCVMMGGNDMHIRDSEFGVAGSDVTEVLYGTGNDITNNVAHIYGTTGYVFGSDAASGVAIRDNTTHVYAGGQVTEAVHRTWGGQYYNLIEGNMILVETGGYVNHAIEASGYVNLITGNMFIANGDTEASRMDIYVNGATSIASNYLFNTDIVIANTSPGSPISIVGNQGYNVGIPTLDPDVQIYGNTFFPTTLLTNNDTYLGTSGNDSYSGVGGLDTIYGGAGNDSLYGGRDNDLLYGEDGNEYMDGGIGRDTVYGGDGNDTIVGGTGIDIIYGDAGNDYMGAGTGNDTFYGGSGTDGVTYQNATERTIASLATGRGGIGTDVEVYDSIENLVGSPYNDWIEGDSVGNVLNGLAGNDTLSGLGANDSLSGGDDNDLLIPGEGTDSVEGGNGTDTVSYQNASAAVSVSLVTGGISGDAAGDIYSSIENAAGSTGDDTISAVSSGSMLWGLAGNDSLVGGAGNDTLQGDEGANTLSGDSGNDTYNVASEEDVVQESLGGGDDTVVTVLTSYVLADNVERLSFDSAGSFATPDAAVPSLMISIPVGFDGTGNAQGNTITGGAGDDTLDGAGDADTLTGYAGNDTYRVDHVNDSIIELADEGTDTVETTLSSYTLGADLENLSYTGSGDFSGTGTAAANVLTGGGGNDTLDGSTGADTLIGSVGNDFYIIDDAGDVVTELAAEGVDTVQTALTAHTLAENAENLTYTGAGDFTATGNASANLLTGGAGNDSLDGSTGADTLAGGAGDDVYVVDASDVVTENAAEGTDTVVASSSSFTLGGNIESLSYSGSGDFAGTGDASDNTITGGIGNDTLDGGAGVDSLIGGVGNDTYVIDNVSDAILELTDEGQDTVSTQLSSFTLVSHVENLSYTGSGDFSGTGTAAANVLTGGSGNDTLDGSTGADTLIGSVGNDVYAIDDAGDVVTELAAEGVDTVQTALTAHTLAENVENLTYTGAGDFTATGNASANLLTGGAGNDSLDGSSGADTMAGGAGDDVYVVDASDVVNENAAEGNDTAVTSLASYALGDNLESLTYSGADAFSGTGNSDANTITGGIGNDTLDGGAGADSLIGGVGNDTYVIDNVSDAILELADEGQDTVSTQLSSFTLGSHLENLSYAGVRNFTGTGNSSDNAITGGAGADSLSGQGGADTLDGGTGADTLAGGIGNDRYIVGESGVLVSEESGEGTDEVVTSLASYTLGSNVENLSYSGSGNFTGSGNGDNNLLTAGAGNDSLDGSGGADTMLGGSGNDVYVVDSASDVVTENAAAGTDTVRTALSSHTLASNVENLTYTGAATFAGTGNTSNNVITGGSGKDTLSGGDGDDTLIGGAGADSLVGGNGVDTVSYEYATADVRLDLLTGGTQGDALGDSYSGIEDITGSAYNDQLVASNVSNNLRGLGGDDVIYGRQGDDTLDGGEGNDMLHGSEGADALIGGAGTDIASYYFATSGVALDLDTGGTVGDASGDSFLSIERVYGSDAGNDTIRGSAEANQIRGFGGDDVLYGEAGGDTLFGDNGNDTLYGDEAADYISGDAGNDLMAGGLGADTFLGGTGIDTISYAAATAGIRMDLVSGGTEGEALGDAYSGIENIIGSAHADQLYGDANSNWMQGLGGNDVIYGRAGNDTMEGGDNDDLLYGDDGSDILIGGAGFDSTSYYSAASGVVLDVDTGGTSGDAAGDTYSSIERFYGSNGYGDTISGSAADEQFRGLGGNDSLSGEGEGDIIYGDSGNDTLDGGAGNDLLGGDAGYDVFVFSATFGTDTVADFDYDPTGGQDLLDLRSFGITSSTYDASVLSGLITASSYAGGVQLAVNDTVNSHTGVIRLQGASLGGVDGSDFVS